jgi:hypothetical protein
VRLELLINQIAKTPGARGPQGPRGLSGPPGKNGSDATADINAIVSILEKRFNKPITFQMLDESGRVKQQHSAYLGGTVQFQLTPVGE